MALGFRLLFRNALLAVAFQVLTGSSLAQAPATTLDSPARSGLSGIPQDWSSQRIIYTRNGSVDDMMKVRNDPRFLNSYLLHNMREHRSQVATSGAGAGSFDDGAPGEDAFDPQADGAVEDRTASFVPLTHRPPAKNKHTKVDWAVDLGPSWGMAIGESPALYTVSPAGTPTCTKSASQIGDFIVYSLKAAPTTGSQANLVGLTNLYAGTSPTGYCGSAPTFLFSYAIGTGGSLLSPVISLDGTKIAWIENSSANHAILHVTKWAYGQGTNATTGSVGIGSGSSDVAIDYTSSAYPGCSASPYINTNSEIYVDYPSDTAFVGADDGILYHVKGIFKGTPTFDFCIPVNTSAGTALSGGVYDTVLNPAVFFISDSRKIYAYSVGASSFTLITSYTYGAGTLTGPGPLLDAFNNFIYLFSADDLAGHTSVTQLSTSLSSHSVVPLGPASTNSYPILFYGTFDNTYFNNGPANSKSTLYSCGTDPTTTTAQDLYSINFNATTGVMNTTALMGANTHVNPGGLNGTCSPITEFFDGTTDRIFVGMGQHSATTGANVVQMWNVTSQLTSTSSTYTAQAANYAGGSSGIVIDNSASSTQYPQAESIYFTTLSAGATFTTCGASRYCAVKLTQSGLQ